MKFDRSCSDIGSKTAAKGKIDRFSSVTPGTPTCSCDGTPTLVSRQKKPLWAPGVRCGLGPSVCLPATRGSGFFVVLARASLFPLEQMSAFFDSDQELLFRDRSFSERASSVQLVRYVHLVRYVLF